MFVSRKSYNVLKRRVELLEIKLEDRLQALEREMKISIPHPDLSGMYFIPSQYQAIPTTSIKEVVELILAHLGLQLSYKPERREMEKFLLQPQEAEKQKKK